MGEVGQEWASVESSLLAGGLGGDAREGGKEAEGYLGSLGWLMGVQNQGQNEVQGPIRTPERATGLGGSSGDRERDGGNSEIGLLLHCNVLRSTAPYRDATQSNVLCCAVLCCAVLCCAVQCTSALCSALLRCAVLSCPVQCSAVQHGAVLRSR